MTNEIGINIQDDLIERLDEVISGMVITNPMRNALSLVCVPDDYRQIEKIFNIRDAWMMMSGMLARHKDVDPAWKERIIEMIQSSQMLATSILQDIQKEEQSGKRL